MSKGWVIAMPAQTGRRVFTSSTLNVVVARIARELDMREARGSRGVEQPEPELEHLGLETALEHGTRAEAKRPLAYLASDHAREGLPVTPDVGEQGVDVLVRVGDELLEDHLEARIVRLPPRRAALVGVVGDDSLVAEAEGVLLALRPA